MANPIRKYAIILNGDTEERHVGNVTRALKVLKRERFETFVAGTERPKHGADHYTTATPQDVARLIAQVRAKIDANDELVIYTTGHGKQVGDEGQLCLGNDCYGREVTEPLDRLVYGRRTIIADQCYGGNWKGLFIDDPKTLFVAAGGKGEQVCCQEFAPRFWDDKIPDLDRDRRISWRERYEHALSQPVSSSLPVIASSPGYDTGKRGYFPHTVREVRTGAELEAALRRLGPGQYAIVTFSATWCDPCKDYRPHFDQFARDANGAYLFLRTENEELAAAYGAWQYPTVMVMDRAGQRRIVTNPETILEEMAEQHLSPELRRTLVLQHRDQLMTQTLGRKGTASFTAAIALGKISLQLSTADALATLVILRQHFGDASPKRRGRAILAYGAMLMVRDDATMGHEARAAFDALLNDRSPEVAYFTLFTLTQLAPFLTEQQSLTAMANVRYYLFSNPVATLDAISDTRMEELYTALVSHLSSTQQVAAELRTLRALLTGTNDGKIGDAMSIAYISLARHAATTDARTEAKALADFLINSSSVPQWPPHLWSVAAAHTAFANISPSLFLSSDVSLYVRLLSDHRPEFQQAGLVGGSLLIRFMTPYDRQGIVSMVLPLLTARNPMTRLTAISAIVYMKRAGVLSDEQYASGLEILKRLTRDRNPDVRRSATQVLTRRY